MDRSPLGRLQGGEATEIQVSDDKFLRDHATGTISAEYYDQCVAQTIAHLRRFL